MSLRGKLPVKGKCRGQICKLYNICSVFGANIWQTERLSLQVMSCERLHRHATCSVPIRPGCTQHPCRHKTRCQRPLHLTVSENYLILTVRIEMVTRSKPYQLERLANVSGLVMGAVGCQWKTFAFKSV